MATIIATTLAGDTLDQLCWRELGTTDGGVVEQALTLNYGLADYGPVLPAPIDVILPAPATAQPATINMVQLWT